MKHTKSLANIERIFLAFLSVIFAVTFIGCQKEIRTKEQQKVESTQKNSGEAGERPLVQNQADASCDVHFTYEGAEGPEHWGELCPDWALCGTGLAQSPVDIQNAVKDRRLKALNFQWHFTVTNIVNNGHTIQFNVDPGSKLIANGKTYDLQQFHYHHTSEHTINGKYYPLEVHFVHKAVDGRIAVVGILFKKGHSNHLFTRFLSHFPHTEGTYSSSAVINLRSLLPKDQKYYNYQGSLTTPACSEMVNWNVIKGTVEASKEQLTELALILHNNHRPLQALNGRVIHIFANRDHHDHDD